MSRLILKGCEVYLRRSLYASTRQTQIQAYEKETGEPFMTLTTNLPKFDMPGNHVGIKNYAENSGVLTELIELGVVGEPVKTVSSGYVEIHICELLIKF